jgi:hypothetical protein
MNAMKTQLLFASLLAFLAFLSSCTIEKRHYTGGYHIETFTNGQSGTTIFEPRVLEKNKVVSITCKDTSRITSILCEEDTALSQKIITSEESPREAVEKVDDSASREIRLRNKNIFHIEHEGERVNPSVDSEKKDLESLGFLSFIIALVGFITPVGSIFFFIAALIAGISSRKRFRNNPGKYKGAGFGILGIILGVLGLITVLWILFAIGTFAV